MSVCAHDPNCPGHGEVHDKAQAVPDTDWALISDLTNTLIARGPARNESKDRSLAGKKRKKQRRR